MKLISLVRLRLHFSFGLLVHPPSGFLGSAGCPTGVLRGEFSKLVLDVKRYSWPPERVGQEVPASTENGTAGVNLLSRRSPGMRGVEGERLQWLSEERCGERLAAPPALLLLQRAWRPQRGGPERQPPSAVVPVLGLRLVGSFFGNFRLC